MSYCLVAQANTKRRYKHTNSLGAVVEIAILSIILIDSLNCVGELNYLIDSVAAIVIKGVHHLVTVGYSKFARTVKVGARIDSKLQ